MTNELLACPFCGGKEIHRGGIPGGELYVYCPNCHIRTDRYKKLEMAAWAWNTRSPAESSGDWEKEFDKKFKHNLFWNTDDLGSMMNCVEEVRAFILTLLRPKPVEDRNYSTTLRDSENGGKPVEPSGEVRERLAKMLFKMEKGEDPVSFRNEIFTEIKDQYLAKADALLAANLGFAETEKERKAREWFEKGCPVGGSGVRLPGECYDLSKAPAEFNNSEGHAWLRGRSECLAEVRRLNNMESK